MVLTDGYDARVASGATLEHLRFSAMGTPCEIQFVAPGADAARAFAAAATAWVQWFEARYSRYRPDSLVSRINAAAGAGWVALDETDESIFAIADQVFAFTRGILDPTMLPLLRLWNYKAATPRVPTEAEIGAARALVGWTSVQREPGRIRLPRAGMGLDLGGFGKEYAVDAVLALAAGHGLADVLVDFGHDVAVCGAPPGASAWAIGVDNPRQPGTALGRLALRQGGVASSGDYLRGFTIEGRRYGHIVDPRTGWPVDNGCVSVTVVGGSCLEAGLLSTTAFVLGPDAGLRLIDEHFGSEGCIFTTHDQRQTREYYRYVID